MQALPRIITVKVPVDQQLPMLGQEADSHTVFNPYLWIKAFSLKKCSPFGREILSQSGSFLDGMEGDLISFIYKNEGYSSSESIALTFDLEYNLN